VLQGGLTSHFYRMGLPGAGGTCSATTGAERRDAMKNQNNFDFKDLLSFGTFLLALLTFIFLFCK
jgi:hypothetical protein